MKSFISS